MAGGGRREGAGRPKGVQNRATRVHKATIEQLARGHTATALNALVSVARDVNAGAARVSAATALLDRGYGKPRQAIEHTGPDGGAIETKGDSRGLALAILSILREAKVDA